MTEQEILRLREIERKMEEEKRQMESKLEEKEEGDAKVKDGEENLLGETEKPRDEELPLSPEEQMEQKATESPLDTQKMETRQELQRQKKGLLRRLLTPKVTSQKLPPTTEESVEGQETSPGPQENNNTPPADKETEPKTVGSEDSLEGSTTEEEQLSQEFVETTRFVLAPLQSGPTIRCCIKRRWNMIRFKSMPYYFMFQELKDGSEYKKAAYEISLDQFFSSSASLGQVRFNKKQTEFTLSSSCGNRGKGHVHEQLATENNFLGFKKPKMRTVVIPSVDSNLQRLPVYWKSANEPELSNLTVLKDKEPVFNTETGRHELSFGGRVTKPSVKNFQLVSAVNGAEEVVMLFGRVDKNKFVLDYRSPLCAVQAFAIALSTFQEK
ncbi:tubby protein homolog [Hoplias malabaricus]|uniref:tubby protein homolog n=1 Tax=Hoplias malabaricus TaxID=27720 RepID=UPI003462DE23